MTEELKLYIGELNKQRFFALLLCVLPKVY